MSCKFEAVSVMSSLMDSDSSVSDSSLLRMVIALEAAMCNTLASEDDEPLWF